MDHDEGSSSHHKKKKTNDKRRRDDNLDATAERKASHPKSNTTKVGPPKDHFERLLEASCTHYKFPIKHTLKIAA
jgi:hypothetical protein